LTGTSGGEKKAPFGYQEPIGRDAEGSVMVKTAPASSFVMTKSEFLLEFFVVALDDPAMFRYAHQIFQWGGLGQSGEPVLGRFGLLARPLDEEPLFRTEFTSLVIAMGRTYWQSGKTGTQRFPGPFPPTHRLPGGGS
jgi:hypothetical protein